MDNTRLDSAGPAPRPPSDPLHDLRSLGAYRILRRLGEGGMGSVYLGYHEGRNLQVAIKVLGDHLASNQGYIDRFYREAKSGVLLNHPNIVRTLNFGQDRATGKHYLVLEFIDGFSAHALLARLGQLPVGDAVRVALDVARALEHAHSRNVVHRDIKPDNILLTRSGVAKLADLGLAKRTDEASHLTATRQGFGTTHYMPYEQAINARHADGRSDIYALGATLYHLVTGSVPFTGGNHLEVVEKKKEGHFTPASALRPDVPPVLDHILGRMLARKPADRYWTASELIVDFERSGLAAPVPTFADPAQALKDEWVQARQASQAEPTRPDPAVPLRPVTAPAPAPAESTGAVWVLRYRNEEGRLCRGRATTRQVLQRLRRGLLPAQVEARHLGENDFRPLTSYPEFSTVRPARRRRPLTPAPAERNGTCPPPPAGRLWGRLLILAGAAALLTAAVAALYRFVWRA